MYIHVHTQKRQLVVWGSLLHEIRLNNIRKIPQCRLHGNVNRNNKNKLQVKTSPEFVHRMENKQTCQFSVVAKQYVCRFPSTNFGKKRPRDNAVYVFFLELCLVKIYSHTLIQITWKIIRKYYRFSENVKKCYI